MQAEQSIIGTLNEELKAKRQLYEERYLEKSQILELERMLASHEGTTEAHATVHRRGPPRKRPNCFCALRTRKTVSLKKPPISLASWTTKSSRPVNVSAP